MGMDPTRSVAYGRTTMSKEEPYPNGYDGCTDKEKPSEDYLYEGMIAKGVSEGTGEPFELILKGEDIVLIDDLGFQGDRRRYEILGKKWVLNNYTEVTDGSVETREVEERPPIEEREINGPYSLQERHSGCEREHYYWVFRGEEPITTWKEVEEGSFYIFNDGSPPIKVIRKGEEVMMYDSNVSGYMYFEKEKWNPFIMEKVGEAEKGYIYSGP